MATHTDAQTSLNVLPTLYHRAVTDKEAAARMAADAEVPTGVTPTVVPA